MTENTGLLRSPRAQLALLAIVAGVAILGVKYYAAVISGSAALLSDAVEGVVNVIAAIFALGAVVFAEMPADREHPYGHGKIEYFSAAFEGGLVALAAAFIGWGAITALHGQLVHGEVAIKEDLLGRGMVLNLASGAMNGLLGLFLVFMGRRHRSKAIEADGLHVLSDFWTTLGILLGLLAVKLTGMYWLDPVLAICVAALLAWTGFKLIHQSSRALLDVEDPELLAKLVGAMDRLRPADVIALHELKTMRFGRQTHVDVHMVLPGHYPVEKAHDIAEPFGELVMADLGLEGEMHAHLDPCQKDWCQVCLVDPCHERTDGLMGAGFRLTVENATAQGGV